MKQSTNICQRCGQERITQKTWVEEKSAEISTPITYTKTICPDPECQAIVEAGLAKDKAARQERQRIKDNFTANRHKPIPSATS
jgi:hypothetical protein